MSNEPLREADVTLSLPTIALRAHAWSGGSSARVLLLHGLGGNSITWHGVAPVLAARLGARVIAPDLPGFGATRPGPERISVRYLVGLVHALVQGDVAERHLVGADEPAPPPWIIAGNSLGGLVALELAARAPSSVHAVTLSAHALPLVWGRTLSGLRSLLGFAPGLVPGLGRRLMQRYVTRTGLPGVVDDPVRALFADPTTLRAELRERLLLVSEERMGWAEEAARAYEQVMQSITLELVTGRAARAIAEVRCPVQVIYGSHDPLYPEAAWARLRELRRDWRYVRMHPVGHVPQLEAPDEFAEHMLDWLGQLPRARVR